MFSPFSPTVPSIYFWRLKTITPQNFIEGNPAFQVHGKVQAYDGGVAFDGQTGFLTTDMSATDCLIDPTLCSKGLSIGMNVMFDKSVNEYKDPRYLLDTGAQSSQTRGVSMYIKDGRLFFNLAISQKSWEVRCFIKRMPFARMRNGVLIAEGCMAWRPTFCLRQQHI